MPHNPEVRMITKALIVKHSFQDKNFKDALIKDYLIKIAQEKHIKPILTIDLYDEIIAQLNTVPQTVSTLNQVLLDFIEPALAFFVKAEALPDIMTQVTSKGIMLNNTEFSTAVTDKQRADLRATIFDHAHVLAALLTAHLNHEDNIDNYPLYENTDVNVENELDRLGDIVIN